MPRLFSRPPEPQLQLTYRGGGAGVAAPARRASTLPKGLRVRTPRLLRSAFDTILWVVATAWHWVATALLLACIGGLGFGAWHVLMASPFFQLAEIEVIGAKGPLADEVQELLAIKDGRGINLLLLKAGEVEAQVAAHPRIAWAEVHKVYPGVLQIRVEERKPVAILATSPMYLLDDEGVAIEEIEAGHFGELGDMPFVSGISSAAVTLGQRVDDSAVEALLVGWRVLRRADSPLVAHIAELHAARGDIGLELVFDSGTRVRIGPAFTATGLASLEALAAESSDLSGFATVDLRFRGQIVYRLRGLLPGKESAS